jgi:hypothetical protein
MLAAAAFTAAFAAGLVHHGMPALGDFGDWVYESVLFRDVLLVLPHGAYLIKHYPVPNSFNTVVMGVLMLAMPWQWAAKAYLCLQLAFQFAAAVIFFHAVRSVHPGIRPAVWLVVPGAAFVGVNFWYGFMNFQAGIAWAMLVCALLLWRARPNFPYAILLVAAFFTHMIPCAFACTAVVFAAISDRRPRRLLALLPTAAFTAWYLVGRFAFAHNADARAPIDTQIVYLSPAFFAFKVNSFLKSFGFVNPSTNLDHSVALQLFGDNLFRALFAVNAILAAIFFWLIVTRCVRSLRTGGLDAFLWLAVLVFGVIYLVAPGMALGVSDPGARALQVSLWIAIFLAADSVWLTRIAAGCAVCLFAANVYLFSKLGTLPVLPVAASSPQRADASAALQPSHLPGYVTHFAHIPYQDKVQYYQAIERGDFSMEIFPTGLFLKR